MNPFPLEHSVLVLDNCHIHHNQDFIDLVEQAGIYNLADLFSILMWLSQVVWYSFSLHTPQIVLVCDPSK